MKYQAWWETFLADTKDASGLFMGRFAGFDDSRRMHSAHKSHGGKS